MSCGPHLTQLTRTRVHARTVQMRRPVADMGGLDARMAEAGDNLSAGQRQLFCLARCGWMRLATRFSAELSRGTNAASAWPLSSTLRRSPRPSTATSAARDRRRALLQDAKVLVLDEATANVDRDTDALILSALDQHVHGHAATAEAPSDASSLARRSAGGGGGGRVLLIIAHRIDTIMDADHLLVSAVAQRRLLPPKHLPRGGSFLLDAGSRPAREAPGRAGGEAQAAKRVRVDDVAVQVLGAGELLEQGVPRELATREGGTFAGMVQAARLNSRPANP